MARTPFEIRRQRRVTDPCSFGSCRSWLIFFLRALRGFLLSSSVRVVRVMVREVRGKILGLLLPLPLCTLCLRARSSSLLFVREVRGIFYLRQ